MNGSDWSELFESLAGSAGLRSKWDGHLPCVFSSTGVFEDLTMSSVRSSVEADGTIADQAGRVDFDEIERRGWTNAAMAADWEQSLQEGTVVFNAAGLAFADVATGCRAAIDAFELPMGANVYVTRPGLARSAPAHTDRQDVFAFQLSGRKRWRIGRLKDLRPYDADAFARGKGDDVIDTEEKVDWLLDVILDPGDGLFVPRGLAHETSTILPEELDSKGDASVSLHATFGFVTGATWGLAFETLLRLAVPSTTLDARLLRRDRNLHDALHASLPLGYDNKHQDVLALIRADPILSRAFEAASDDAISSAFLRINEHHKTLLAEQRNAYEPNSWQGSFTNRAEPHFAALANHIDDL